MLKTFDGGISAGLNERRIQMPRQRAIKNVVHQGRLAGAGDSGDHGEQSERKRDVDLPQVIVRAPRIVIALPFGKRLSVGTGIRRAPQM